MWLEDVDMQQEMQGDGCLGIAYSPATVTWKR